MTYSESLKPIFFVEQWEVKVAKIILLQKVMLHYGKKSVFWSFNIFGYLSFTTVRRQKIRFNSATVATHSFLHSQSQWWMYKIFKHRKVPCLDETHIKLQWYSIFPSLFFLFLILQRNVFPLQLCHQTSAIYRTPTFTKPIKPNIGLWMSSEPSTESLQIV